MARLANECTWFELDLEHLAEMMRYVYEHREEAAKSGSSGSDNIRRNYSWAVVAARCRERIGALLGMHAKAIV